MSGSTLITEANGPSPLQVMAAVIRRADGHILIAQRSARQHQAGKWEFPGGKRESGESREAALERELAEELGIGVRSAHPLLQVLHRYPDKAVWLDVWEVKAFSGDPYGREGQPIQWVSPDALVDYPFPAANRPIVTAARLPDYYWITPDYAPDQHQVLANQLVTALQQGIKLIQLRLKSWPTKHWLGLLDQLAEEVRASGACLLVNSDMLPDLSLVQGLPHTVLSGIQLSGSGLYKLEERPNVPWLAASCHTRACLQRCMQLGVDFATLSPIKPTLSHPTGNPLGLGQFGEWVRGLALPVYALGGLSADDLPAVRAAGGRGVAGIRNILKQES